MVANSSSTYGGYLIGAGPNACATVKTLFDTYWTKALTDGKTPRIVNAQDENDPNAGIRSSNSMDDYIRIYEEAPGHRESSGIGNQGRRTENHLSVDINSSISQAHAIKVLSEAQRILDTYCNTPGAGFDYLLPDQDTQNFSGTRYQRMWRWVISITLLKTNAPLGT